LAAMALVAKKSEMLNKKRICPYFIRPPGVQRQVDNFF